MRPTLALLGCVLLATTIASEELNKDETIVRDYMKNKIDRPDSLVQQPQEVDTHVYTKFPSWVVTEADMEAFFKQQKTNVVRTNTGVPEKAVPAKSAQETELVQEFTKFPSWVSTEADMEAYFKQQHTKVIRKDTGNKGKNPSKKVTKKTAPEATLLQSPYAEQKDKDDPFAWAHLEEVSQKPKESLFHNTITDSLEEDNKVDLDNPKTNSYDSSALLGGEQKRIEQGERQRLIEQEYDDEDELIQELLTPEQ